MGTVVATLEPDLCAFEAAAETAARRGWRSARDEETRLFTAGLYALGLFTTPQRVRYDQAKHIMSSIPVHDEPPSAETV